MNIERRFWSGLFLGAIAVATYGVYRLIQWLF